MKMVDYALEGFNFFSFDIVGVLCKSLYAIQIGKNIQIIVTLKTFLTNSQSSRIGQAIKIEEYVPTTTPTIMTNANPCIAVPPTK